MMYQVLDTRERPIYRVPGAGLIPLMLPARGGIRERIHRFGARLAWWTLLAIGGTVRPAARA
jgi:hypothetical protein